MKIILITTTFLVAVLAIGLIGINNYNNNNNKISNVFAQENAVSIAAGSFNPSTKEFCVPKESTVYPGTTVTWTNDDTTTIHTVVEGGPQSGGATPVFDSSIIAPGATWDNTVDTAGEFTYYCNLHPFMTGKVTVS
jgi:plastocyanin